MGLARKRYNPVSLTLRIIDTLLVLAAWEAAYYIRFHIFKEGFHGLEVEIIALAPAILVITLTFFTHNDLYAAQRYFSWYHEIFSIFKSHFQSISTFVVLLYFINPSRLSRIMLAIYTLLTVVLSLIFRLIMRSILYRMRMKGKNLKHVVLIGHSQQILNYANRIVNSPELGLRISGWVDSQGEAVKLGVDVIDQIEDIPINGDRDSPDSLIISYSSHDFNRMNSVLAFFNKTVIPVWLLPDLEQALIGYTIEDFHGVPLVKFNGNRLTMIGTISKRLMDIFGALIGLTLFSPVMLFMAVAVKMTSRGPVFYGQKRVSLEGYLFTMWKFRSMRTDAEKESGAVWASKDDDRTTKIGKFMRRTSMDELPQFWNVLKGDMSLVGPRPERPMLVDEFKEEIPAYMLRHKMKSGITGWAQVNGWRGDTSLEKRIEYDIYYIQHWDLALDIKILLLTFLKGFVHQNAY